MGKYWRFRGHENLDKAMFPGSGPFEVPALGAVQVECSMFVGFDQAYAWDKAPEETGLHFLMYDKQFERIWTNPDDYLSMFRKFKCLCAPDFSLYTDYPRALQIWNHYRKHWLAAYWTSLGFTVLPTIAWSDETSFSWCFSGEPIGSDVVISSVGTQATDRAKYLFSLGYHEMIRRLQPRKIYFQGVVPKGCTGDIVEIPTNIAAVRKRVKA